MAREAVAVETLARFAISRMLIAGRPWICLLYTSEAAMKIAEEIAKRPESEGSVIA